MHAEQWIDDNEQFVLLYQPQMVQHTVTTHSDVMRNQVNSSNAMMAFFSFLWIPSTVKRILASVPKLCYAGKCYTHKHTHTHTHTHTDTDPNTQILTISAGAMGRWAPMAVKLKGQMAAQKPYNKSHREWLLQLATPHIGTAHTRGPTTIKQTDTVQGHCTAAMGSTLMLPSIQCEPVWPSGKALGW